MTSEIKASLDDKVTKKEYTHALEKNPKRVFAGKKGAEAKKNES